MEDLEEKSYSQEMFNRIDLHYLLAIHEPFLQCLVLDVLDGVDAVPVGDAPHVQLSVDVSRQLGSHSRWEPKRPGPGQLDDVSVGVGRLPQHPEKG